MVDYFFDILRILAEFAQLGREHPLWVFFTVGVPAILRYLAGSIVSTTLSHLWTEYVLKRAMPPAPSPTEDALVGRVEALSRALVRAEAERDAACGEAERLREERDAECRRADRLEAELRDALRPPRRRRPRTRRTRRRGRR